MNASANQHVSHIEISDPQYECEGLRQVTAFSVALRRRADVTFFVPPQAHGLQGVPLFILLHGVYGSHWAWSMKAGAHRIAAQIISANPSAPFVLAMPSDGLWGHGSGYLPHQDSDAESWIVDAVPMLASQACTAVDASSKLCIGGLSMGGFGALRLAAKFPHRFAAAAAHSSITHIDQHGRFTPDDRSGWQRSAADENLVAAFQSVQPLRCALSIDCGTEDPQLADNRELHARMQAANIAHQYEEHPGAHDWSYWRYRLPATLRFFSDACLSR